MITQSIPRRIIRIITTIVVILVIIGIAAVIRRSLTLAGVIKPFVHPKYGAFDSGFQLNKVLTFVHIIPGALFMILAPLQFVPGIRAHHLWFHRLSGRILVILGLIVGFTALIVSFKTNIGGTTETAATVLFASIFLFSLVKGFYHIRRHEIALHREWMIRMFAIGFAIATVRPIVGLFFAFSRLSPHQFFGIAFWIGFTIHLIAAEVWVNYTRKRNVPVIP